jgi:hypothetical protein
MNSNARKLAERVVERVRTSLEALEHAGVDVAGFVRGTMERGEALDIREAIEDAVRQEIEA